jgi:hypothetical protein
MTIEDKINLLNDTSIIGVPIICYDKVYFIDDLWSEGGCYCHASFEHGSLEENIDLAIEYARIEKAEYYEVNNDNK